MPSRARAKKNNYRKKRPTRKPRGRRLPKAKAVSETKLIKQICLLDNNPLFTTAQIHHTPYWQGNLEDSFNFTLTNNGNNSADRSAKDFINNGTGMNERIGRQVTIIQCKERLILDILPVGDHVSSLPLQFRIIQGWVKEGIDNYMDLTTEVTTLYSEVNWNKYKVLKDYIINRRPLNAISGATSQVNSYKSIEIKNTWSPNKVIKWGGDSTDAGQPPAQYLGYAPFLLIFNPKYATYKLNTIFFKRTITFKDL